MSDLRQEIESALKAAMKAKDSVRVGTLRFLLSDVKRIEVDERRALSREEILDVIVKGTKKRRETIEIAEAQGRADVLAAERAELQILEEFLPTQFSEEELIALVDDCVRDALATSKKDQGKVMGLLMPRIKGRADGKVAARLVSERLT